tara:strand:- start:3002 stop:3709 length:708 start_codon:yes stop_codon:yes gene_type:complete
MNFQVPNYILFSLITLVIILLASLGFWQIERNEWKQNLIDKKNANVYLEPLNISTIDSIDKNLLDYRQISVKGEWDFSHSFFLGNKVRKNNLGEEVVVPFLLADNSGAILTNRGWYPVSDREKIIKKLQKNQSATLEGLIRVTEYTGKKTSNGVWTAFDHKSMGKELPYDIKEWIVVEGKEETTNKNNSSYPIQGWMVYTSTTPHIEYALTWFGLALVLLIVTITRFIKKQRPRN